MTRWQPTASTSTVRRVSRGLSYFPELDNYNTGPDAYLHHIEEAKRSLSIPVIGSLNGTSKGGWVRYGKLIQEAGADALELNIYHVVTDPFQTGNDVESRLRRSCRGGSRGRHDPYRRQVGAFLQLVTQHDAPAHPGRRERPGPVQPLPPTGYRPGDAPRDSEPDPEHQQRTALAAPVDRHPAGRSLRHLARGNNGSAYRS